MLASGQTRALKLLFGECVHARTCTVCTTYGKGLDGVPSSSGWLKNPLSLSLSLRAFMKKHNYFKFVCVGVYCTAWYFLNGTTSLREAIPIVFGTSLPIPNDTFFLHNLTYTVFLQDDCLHGESKLQSRRLPSDWWVHPKACLHLHRMLYMDLLRPCCPAIRFRLLSASLWHWGSTNCFLHSFPLSEAKMWKLFPEAQQQFVTKKFLSR